MKTGARVNTKFKDTSESRLSVIAAAHRAAIAVAPGSTNFPDIPYDAAALATIISNYNITLAAAYKGTKTETLAKDNAKGVLIIALQQNATYVNQVGKQFYHSKDYFTTRAFLATSGFPVNNVSKPAGPMEAPMIREITSPEIGQMKIILGKFSKSGRQRTKKVRGTAVYEINYRTAASGTTAGPWKSYISSAYFALIGSLVAGEYEVYVTAKGANSISAPTATRKVVVL